MRIHFGTTAPVDLTAKALKKALRPHFPKLSLNRVRNAVARAYGYSNYTALQRSLDPTADPALGALVSLEAEPEQMLKEALEELLAVECKVPPDQTHFYAASALASTRTARASAGEELTEEVAFGANALIAALVDEVLRQIETLKLHQSLGDALYIRLLGQADDRAQAFGLDGSLRLYVSGHGEVRLLTESKNLAWRQGEPPERLNTYSRGEQTYLTDDWGEQDFKSWLDTARGLPLDAWGIEALYTEEVVDRGFGPKLDFAADMFEQFPPPIAKEVVRKLLIIVFAQMLVWDAATALSPFQSFQHAFGEFLWRLDSLKGEDRPPFRVPPEIDVMTYIKPELPPDPDTPEAADRWAFGQWVNVCSQLLSEHLVDLAADPDAEIIVSPRYEDLVPCLTRMIEAGREQAPVSATVTDPYDDSMTPCVAVSLWQHLDGGLRIVAKRLEVAASEHESPAQVGMTVKTLLKELNRVPAEQKAQRVSLEMDDDDSTYACFDAWFGSGTNFMFDLTSDPDEFTPLYFRAPMPFERTLVDKLRAAGVSDEALCLMSRAERTGGMDNGPPESVLQLSLLSSLDPLTEEAISWSYKLYDFDGLEGTVSDLNETYVYEGGESALCASWSIYIDSPKWSLARLAKTLKPILEWHYAESQRLRKQVGQACRHDTEDLLNR